MISISVVMPVYNSQKYIRAAIESILNQTFKDFELIIVDDGSTDNSINIINSFTDPRIKVINLINGGVARALNIGISYANSAIIARMDSDDISLPNRLAKQFHFLTVHPEVIMVGTGARVIDEEDNFVYLDEPIINFEKIKQRLPKSSFYHPSVMFRKDSFIKCDGYPEYMKRAQDAVLFTKMSKIGVTTNLLEPLIKYRITSSSLSVRSKKDKAFINDIINQALNSSSITKEASARLNLIITKTKPKNRKYHYHIFLIKKYLWNNYNPVNALHHWKKAGECRQISLEMVILRILIFMPERLIKSIYNFLI